MPPPYHCELDYFPSLHLAQIYAGFARLEQKGIVTLSVRPVRQPGDKPVLHVTLDSSKSLVFDTLDGLNWIEGTLDDNLYHFGAVFHADYYFKRSFIETLQNYCPEGCTVHPLGLNYYVEPPGFEPRSITTAVKRRARATSLARRLNRGSVTALDDLEFYPVGVDEDPSILFYVGLWDPEDVSDARLQQERHEINTVRLDCVRALRSEFGNRFTGGIQPSKYACHVAPELVVSASATARRQFVTSIRKHSICVATTGLHRSTGFKFGEYVAAARAIVSEPLAYALPGRFREGENYLSFSSAADLVAAAHRLRNDLDLRHRMMWSNFSYYNEFVRPDMIVLNALLKTEGGL